MLDQPDPTPPLPALLLLLCAHVMVPVDASWAPQPAYSIVVWTNCCAVFVVVALLPRCTRFFTNATACAVAHTQSWYICRINTSAVSCAMLSCWCAGTLCVWCCHRKQQFLLCQQRGAHTLCSSNSSTECRACTRSPMLNLHPGSLQSRLVRFSTDAEQQACCCMYCR